MSGIAYPTECPDCGAPPTSFTLDHIHEGRAGIVDGRHCMNEIKTVVFLGCDECSATLRHWPLDDLLNSINDERKVPA